MLIFFSLPCSVSFFLPVHLGGGGRGVKINLGDETYVSGPKSYCTWLSVEIKHMDTSGAARFGVPAVNI